MASIKRRAEENKCTYPSEIIKSERRVAEVKEVLVNESLNLFNPDQEYLFNIGSEIPVYQGLVDRILATKEKGKRLIHHVSSKPYTFY